MRLSLFIARRLYSKSSGTKRASLPAIRIATVGVAVGLAVMIVAVAIVKGFKHEISSKVIGFGSHIALLNSGTSPSGEGSPIVLDKVLLNKIKSVDGVRKVQPFSMKTGLLKTDEQFSGITFKGIGSEYDTHFIASHIIEGKLPDFGGKASQNEIVISSSTANSLKVGVGSKLYAYFFDGGLRARRFTVAGIYRTDMTQFDDVLVFANEQTVKKLCKWNADEATGLEIVVSDFEQLAEISLRVAKIIAYYNIDNETSYISYNIKEIHPQIFDWLSLLNVNIWVILVLMLAVAGVTIISGLLILILERTGTIALLKTLGARNMLIRRIFIDIAVFILLRGMVAGNIVGIALLFLQKQFKIVGLDAESYYIDSVPVEFDFTAIALINVATFVISTAALVLPSYMVARISPSKVLRFE